MGSQIITSPIPLGGQHPSNEAIGGSQIGNPFGYWNPFQMCFQQIQEEKEEQNSRIEEQSYSDNDNSPNFWKRQNKKGKTGEQMKQEDEKKEEGGEEEENK